MNTREKIVDPQALRGAGATLVTAYFDPMLAWHAERFAQIRAESRTLAACILPLSGELLRQRARAEMAAALRVIDYVLISPGPDSDATESFIRSVEPSRIIRLEDEDLRRRAELIADVRSRQNR
jgi:hypothetical protein